MAVYELRTAMGIVVANTTWSGRADVVKFVLPTDPVYEVWVYQDGVQLPGGLLVDLEPDVIGDAMRPYGILVLSRFRLARSRALVLKYGE